MLRVLLTNIQLAIKQLINDEQLTRSAKCDSLNSVNVKKRLSKSNNTIVIINPIIKDGINKFNLNPLFDSLTVEVVHLLETTG